MKIEIEFTEEQRQKAIEYIKNAARLFPNVEPEKAQSLLQQIDNGEVDNKLLYKVYVLMETFGLTVF